MGEGIKGEQLIHPRDIWMEVVTQDPVGNVLGALLSTIK
jgi:hypothetical protein